MFNGFDLSTIQDAKFGNSQVSSIYYGANLIWPTTPHDYSQDYLTIVALEGGWITWEGSHNITISVSTDNGTTWTAYQSTPASSFGTHIATLNAGEKILIKGNNTSYGFGGGGAESFRTLKKVNIQGNIMSLIYGDNFIGQTSLSGSYNFDRMFTPADVVSAKNLILPATVLTPYCYTQMFGLTTELTTAPELPATTLVEGCYYGMFDGCSNLNYIKCLATDISATDATHSWVNSVAATGTFVKDANTTWPSGTSGIPSDWTVQNV